MHVLLNAESIKLLQNGNLPVQLTVPQAAVVLGFLPPEIRVLVEKKMLHPLATPVANVAKSFAADEVAKLAGNFTWLDEATQIIYASRKLKKRRLMDVESLKGSNEAKHHKLTT